MTWYMQLNIHKRLFIMRRCFDSNPCPSTRLLFSIVSNLSPTLAQSFPDSLTETLSESMREFMASALSESLRPKLVNSLTESPAQEVSLHTTKLLPHKVAEGIHKALHMMLTRSLSHSITLL